MEYVGCMHIINMCRKWGKRLRAMKLFPCLVISLWIDKSCWRSGGCWQAMTFILSCIMSVWSPHLDFFFYLVMQNQVKYANQVKQCTDAVEIFKIGKAHSNHQPSTGTRCRRPRCRKAFTDFLSETTHLHCHISAFSTSKWHYRKSLRNWWPSLLCILKVFFKAPERHGFK